VATTAILTVGHCRHEHTSATRLVRTFSAEPFNLPIAVDLVIFENGQLGLLPLVLDLLRGGVHLLLPLLSATTESEDEVQGGLLLDIIVAQGPAIFKLLAGKDESLLIRRDSFFVLDLRFDVVDGVRGLDLEGDRLTREGFNEDLHCGM